MTSRDGLICCDQWLTGQALAHKEDWRHRPPYAAQHMTRSQPNVGCTMVGPNRVGRQLQVSIRFGRPQDQSVWIASQKGPVGKYGASSIESRRVPPDQP